ncbi:hypothetical protein NDU88_004908 [Pleurodeles waltl]|uniref:Uncharacterized protein n=1 Tax=Pleurodeles waltl TaxID=8319 RepID=A0AAV7TAG5_PLEWA|nr:hypothetical protein NDU88_004908 [Pleurodeles waltl]
MCHSFGTSHWDTAEAFARVSCNLVQPQRWLSEPENGRFHFIPARLPLRNNSAKNIEEPSLSHNAAGKKAARKRDASSWLTHKAKPEDARANERFISENSN